MKFYANLYYSKTSGYIIFSKKNKPYFVNINQGFYTYYIVIYLTKYSCK